MISLRNARSTRRSGLALITTAPWGCHFEAFAALPLVQGGV